MLQPVVAQVLSRCPRYGKMEGTLIRKTRTRDPTGRRRATPLTKENLVLGPRPSSLVLNLNANKRRKKL